MYGKNMKIYIPIGREGLHMSSRLYYEPMFSRICIYICPTCNSPSERACCVDMHEMDICVLLCNECLAGKHRSIIASLGQ